MSLLLLFGNVQVNAFLQAETGTFSLQGQGASLLRSVVMRAASGAFDVFGMGAEFRSDRTLSADPVNVTLTGMDASLTQGVYMGAIPGAFMFVGEDGQLHVSASVSGEAGDFVVTGVDVRLTPHHFVRFEISLDFSSTQVVSGVTCPGIVFTLGCGTEFSSELAIGSVDEAAGIASDMDLSMDEAA
jgi:hypothetical protein